MGLAPDPTAQASPGGKGVNRPTAGSSASGPGRPEKDKSRKLSCKECRRLKLKCDRVFPCQSCVKRGCGSLCPEGIALLYQASDAFILANTEQLHDKILQLGDRVRQLEDALEVMQAGSSSQPHPLLAPELLRIKTSQDLYTASANAQSPTRTHTPGSQKEEHVREPQPVSLYQPTESHYVTHMEVSRVTRFFKNISLGLSLTNLEPFLHSISEVEASPPQVPPDILQLSATFPFPWTVDLKIRKKIRDALPSREEALAICDEARRNALWQYNLDPSETFIENLLHHCYTTPIEDVSPRRLALLLMVLSIGSLVDLNRPLGYVHGEAYHHLARAAVCEIPLMEEPDFDVLHALFFMCWYHLIFSDNKKAIGYAWNLVGFVAKLAQGVNRENTRLKMIPEEHEKRNAVFWELLNLDCRMSLSLGRPPSISLAHVDIKPPAYNATGLYVPKEEIIYHHWKNTFFIQCLTPILEAIVAIKPLPYSRIIELDTLVREFETPAILEGSKSEEISPRFLVMQRGLVAMSKAIGALTNTAHSHRLYFIRSFISSTALLQLHRRHFTEAMSGPEPFTLQHKYTPSVLATYLGTSSLISAVEELYERERQLSVRFLHFWFNSFSASVTLALFISRAPSASLAPYAMRDLERACALFRRAAALLPFSGKTLPVIEKLADKSRRLCFQWHSPQVMEQSVFYPSSSLKNSPGRLDSEKLAVELDGAHPMLVDFAGQLSLVKPDESSRGQPSSSSSSDGNIYHHHQAQSQRPDTWLPEIYQFTSVGIGIEDRYNFSAIATAQPTPFVPSSPRVAEHANFNFDHGAFTVDLAETSFMAWF
ncbi:hypothetical protein BDN72DRAFT_767830 [Pluteus cervinus]|uniref:Uncharacterized protein n=1 Tax=Pluteus cervinus TaxID=181527 RepID=A0ACD3AW24_9AGAR|nr:hypothetical protein BDN72DRAFT_767830 [Pluteus cervinus]